MYVVEVIYLLIASIFCILAFAARPRDSGFLVLAGMCGGSALFSFYFLSWWPLLAGGVLSVGMLFFGTGGLFRDKADRHNVS
jgi:hypothetical protein